MRRIIAALHVSLDGLVEGANGELDWIRSWEDIFEILDQIDTCILGRIPEQRNQMPANNRSRAAISSSRCAESDATRSPRAELGTAAGSWSSSVGTSDAGQTQAACLKWLP